MLCPLHFLILVSTQEDLLGMLTRVYGSIYRNNDTDSNGSKSIQLLSYF